MSRQHIKKRHKPGKAKADVKSKPMYALIMDHIRSQIEAGLLSPGERVPSETELCEQFKVSRITAKQALTTLAAEGVVYRIHGKGTFVTETGKSKAAPKEEKEQGSRQLIRPTIGLVITRLADDTMQRLVVSIEHEVKAAGFNLLVRSTGNHQDEESTAIGDLVKTGIDGLLMLPADGEFYNDTILELKVTGFPLVLVDRYIRYINCDVVYSDNYGGARQAVNHLIDTGRTRIGFVSTPTAGAVSVEERLSGYRAAIEERGRAFEPALVRTDFSARDAERWVDLGERKFIEELVDFLAGRPEMDAVLAVNDFFALGLIEAALYLERRVPESLAVIGFDNARFSHLAKVSLTTVAQEWERIGKEAVRILLAKMKDNNRPCERVVVDTHLIVRASSAANWRPEELATAGT